MDTQALVAKLKEQGIEMLEADLIKLLDISADWFAVEGLKSENGAVKIAAGMMPMIKPILVEVLDKLDGKDNH